MVKEETWGIDINRARQFFDEQQDVSRQGRNEFAFGGCAISLTELKPKGMGVWAAKRTRVHMEGADEDVAEIYHRFFIRFLTTGG